MDKQELTRRIKAKAKELGFLEVTIAKAEYMEEEARRLTAWLDNDYHGKMSYLADHFDKRVDPRKLIHGAKSVISLSYNYYTEKKQYDECAPKVATYAYGKDYHRVVKKKLLKLFRWIRRELTPIEGRCFVDSGPILERDWAKRSGMGWVGKNTLLLNRERGSYFFLSEIICDLELEYDNPLGDYCGTCTRCIDACPTDAISPQGYLVDGSKCISYLTIELKDEIPKEFSGKMGNYVLGCDICQEVCPWNRFSTRHTEPKFEPNEAMLSMTKSDWEEITEEAFDIIFHGSPMKRAQYKGLKRNVAFLNEGAT